MLPLLSSLRSNCGADCWQGWPESPTPQWTKWGGADIISQSCVNFATEHAQYRSQLLHLRSTKFQNSGITVALILYFQSFTRKINKFPISVTFQYTVHCDCGGVGTVSGCQIRVMIRVKTLIDAALSRPVNTTH